MDANEPKKPTVKILTLVPQMRPTGQKAVEHREMETLAATVAQQFRASSRKLRALRPQVQQIQDYFASSVRGSVKLAGCSSFGEFCEKKLGRTRQAVYALLGDYPQKQKEKKKRQPKRCLVYDGGLTQEDVTRMQTGLNAVYRFEQAKEKGDDEEARSAWEEYTRIAAAEPVRSQIEGDRPNARIILVDLLSLLERVLSVLHRIIESGMIAEDADLTTAAKSSANTADRFCGAVRRRLNIGDPTTESRRLIE